MNKQPVFLTDRDRLVVLEAIAGMPNAAVPDSLKPFEVLEPNTSEGASEKHLPIIETDGNHVTVKVGSALTANIPVVALLSGGNDILSDFALWHDGLVEDYRQ